jgi:UDP-N-acetylmuramate: L-alanyl-gamma-D-glutamyl-meso-diaminopimelate ligase
MINFDRRPDRTASRSGQDHILDRRADAIVKCLEPDLRSGDVVVIMSNGGFGGIHGKLLDALKG